MQRSSYNYLSYCSTVL